MKQQQKICERATVLLFLSFVHISLPSSHTYVANLSSQFLSLPSLPCRFLAVSLPFLCVVGTGASFAKEHASWYMQRKVSSHLFSRNNFRSNMQDTFARKAKILIGKLDKACALGSGAGAGSVKEPIDMQANFFVRTNFRTYS